MMTHSTVVKRSKLKLIAFLAGSCVFVACGVWMFNLSTQDFSTNRRLGSPFMTHSMGALITVFFGSIGIFVAIKLFDSSPGLILNPEGLIENTNPFSIGFIAWSDIKGFEVQTIQNQKMLYVLLFEPEKHISKCSPWKYAMLKFSLRFSPSPVAISANSLKIAFDEMFYLVESYFQSATAHSKKNA